MRRALVLTDDSARHPFRASLPAHVREPLPDGPEPFAPLLSYADLRGFMRAYSACVLAVVTFIA